MSRQAYQEISQSLERLENALKHLGWWSSQPPDPEALSSPEPFCYDTLSLQEWLQWVFIPKMQQLIDSEQSLPDQCLIAPIAEHLWQKQGKKTQALISILNTLDRQISGQKVLHTSCG